jgi:hypothetical protein
MRTVFWIDGDRIETKYTDLNPFLFPVIYENKVPQPRPQKHVTTSCQIRPVHLI